MKKGFNLNKVSFNQAGFPAELNAALEQQAAYDQNRGSNVPLSLALFGRGKEWQAASNKSYLKQISAMLEAQKMADAIAAPRNDTSWAQGVLDVGKQEGSVNSGVPSFYNQQLPEQPGMATPPPPIYSAGFLKDALDKVNAGAAVNFAQQKFANANTNVYNEAAGTNAPLQGAVSQIQNPSYLPYADNIINGLSSVTNNARQYGESNKQFTQEFPGKDAKNKAEAAYLNSQRGVQNAKLAEQLITNQNLPKSIAADNEIKTKQAKKIDTEIANLADKSNQENQKAYGAAAGEYSGAVDYLKGLGGITATGVPDMGKINADPDMKKAYKEMQNAKAKMKQLERFRVEKPKETPGSKTLEMTAPQGQRGLKLPSGKML